MRKAKYYYKKYLFFIVPTIFILFLFGIFLISTIHILTIQKEFIQQQISENNNKELIKENTIKFNLTKWEKTKNKIFYEVIFMILFAILSIVSFLILLYRSRRMLLEDNSYILECLKNEDDFSRNIDLTKLHFAELHSIAEYFNRLHNQQSIAYIQSIKNQRNLENILNTMADGIIIHAIDGEIVYVNYSTIKMYGLKNRKDIKNYPTIQSLSSKKNDLSKIYEYCKMAVQGKNIQFEWIAKNIKENSDFNVLVNLTKIIYQHKPVILANIRDISKLIKARKMLKEQNQLYATTLENISDCVIRTNLNFEIRFINKATEKIINKHLNNIKGKKIQSVLKIVDSNTYKDVWKDLERVISNDENISQKDFLVIDWSGKEINVDISTSVIIDSNGEETGFLIVIKDVTSKLEHLKEVAKVRNLESLGLLASGIAHGFNNILTGVFGNISLAKYYLSDNTPAENYLTLAENAMTKAKYLSAKLLTFAEGDKTLVENFSLDNLIYQIINNVSKHYDTNIIYHGNPDLWIISADKNQIEQALINVIENACESMNNKGKVKIKTLNFDNSDKIDQELNPIKYVKIEIEDRGKGIKQSDLSKIFDPYFTTKFLGRGIGLSVVYSIISKHSGKIFIQSKELFGTKVTIYLPISGITKEIIAHEVEKITHYNILLMGKEKSDIINDREFFEDAGYNVIVAENEEELLHLYEIQNEIIDKFDVVIIDLQIAKKMNLLDFIKNIRHFNDDAKLVLSAYEYNAEEIGKYREIGFNDVIFKPFTSGKVLPIIKKIIKKEKIKVRENKKGFKVCSFCGKKWESREEFLEDNDIKLAGYQINYLNIEKGLFLFNHSCNTTLAVEVEDFMDLYKGVRYSENKMNKDGCPGYCLDEKELKDCGNTCYYNQVRKLMLIILGYHEKKA